eukprot:354028-Chlamydomonas_euryale.AAC.6
MGQCGMALHGTHSMARAVARHVLHGEVRHRTAWDAQHGPCCSTACTAWGSAAWHCMGRAAWPVL